MDDIEAHFASLTSGKGSDDTPPNSTASAPANKGAEEAKAAE